MHRNGQNPHVVIVGGGFAGMSVARSLAKHDDVNITLIDKNPYHQFQPLLYQVATCQLASPDIAFPHRRLFRKHPNVVVKQAEVTSVDPRAMTVTTNTGETIQGDYLVLAAGSQPNFFRVPGDEHTFPLYSLQDAERLRARILELFDAADRDPKLIDEGALNFIVVGGGATGTEVAGALSDLIHGAMANEYPHLSASAARIYIFDHGTALLAPFSESAHSYTARVLQQDGVQLRLGLGIKEVGPGHVTISDGSTILSRTVIWGGGIMAAPLAAKSGLPQGRGGRINVQPDLTVEGFPRVYVLGDFANIPSPDGGTFPQLGSVALQNGQWAAKAIRADIEGKPFGSFHYHDKGIMAMINHGHAVAEMGKHHHEMHGHIAFAAWLGIHAYLMTGVRDRSDAFMDWGWDYVSKDRTSQKLDRSNTSKINWGDDDQVEAADSQQQKESELQPASR
jgi:NADH dehydrogenase